MVLQGERQSSGCAASGEAIPKDALAYKGGDLIDAYVTRPGMFYIQDMTLGTPAWTMYAGFVPNLHTGEWINESTGTGTPPSCTFSSLAINGGSPWITDDYFVPTSLGGYASDLSGSSHPTGFSAS